MTGNPFVIVDKATFYRFVANAPENLRCEYVRGRIIEEMNGGTLRHASIAKRIGRIIERQLPDDEWSVLSGSDRGVETAETIRYPDVVVEPAGAPGDSLATTSPAIVVEVLSPSSEVRDLEAKPSEYTSLDSLQAYIVASQDTPSCLVWLRRDDGTIASQPETVEGRDHEIRIPALSVAIPLAEVYRGIAQ